MKARTFAVLLAALALAGCTPDWAEQNDSDVLLIMGFVEDGSGNAALKSDVRNPGIAEDFARLTLRAIPKNTTLAAIDDVNDVILSRYTIKYYRADGRSVEGVDVPYAVSGEMNRLIPANGNAVEANIIVVRHQAKMEPPLRNLFAGEPATGLGGQRVVTMFADIAVFGQTITQKTVTARGRLEIVFADFANE